MYAVRESISLTLPQANGGVLPFIYTLTGTHPNGLSFDAANRILSGTPINAVVATLTYTLTYTVTDSASPPVTIPKTFTVTVTELTLSSTQPPLTYLVRETVLQTLPQASGGITPFTYTLTRDDPGDLLPPGLTFNSDPAVRTISGTPSEPFEPATIRYTAMDANGQTTSQTFMLTVLGLSLANIDPQIYAVRDTVLLTLPAAVGGIAPFTYTLTRTGGAMPVLPPGLSFNDDPMVRTISGASSLPFGVPAGATLVYRVTDVNAETTFQNFTLKVDETVPLAPTGVSADTGDEQLTVRWTAVPGGNNPGFDNGGAVVMSYTAAAVGGGNTFSCTAFGHSATSCTIPNLTNGAEYTVTVIAANENGDSADSEFDTLTLPLLTATGGFTESDATTGAVGGALTFTLLGDTFVTDVANHITVTNVPDSLTPAFVRNSPTLVTMTLGNTADKHADEDDDVTNLMVTFPAAAVASGTAPPGASYTGMIDFVDPIGITLAHPSQNIPALNIQEGETITYTARLDALPTGDVTVDITISSIDNPTDVTITPDSLIFTPDNWRSPQTVTVMAKEDADEDQDTATLTHDASGGGYDLLTAPTLTVTIRDIDVQLVIADPDDQHGCRARVDLTDTAASQRRCSPVHLHPDRHSPRWAEL